MNARRIKPYVAMLAMLAALSVAAGSTQAAQRWPSAPRAIHSAREARAPIDPLDGAAETFSWRWDGWAYLKAFMDRLGGGRLGKSAGGREERDPAGTPDPVI